MTHCSLQKKALTSPSGLGLIDQSDTTNKQRSLTPEILESRSVLAGTDQVRALPQRARLQGYFYSGRLLPGSTLRSGSSAQTSSRPSKHSGKKSYSGWDLSQSVKSTGSV